MRRATRLPTLPPVCPPDGYDLTADGLYLVPGVATVQAAPYRRARDARRFAMRIAGDARAYLPILIGLQVPGIVDLRPKSHCRPTFTKTPGTSRPAPQPRLN